MTRPAPLTGITILDLTKLAPGPFCTMILGDLGADIIKIEEPGPPTGRRAEQAGSAKPMETQDGAASFSALHRNKKSIGINLKSESGKQVYLRLAEQADVVVEEYRPGVAARLGIDYETLAKKNPRLIYCAITGFGQTGPYRDLVGHDLNYIATAGVLSLFGRDPNQAPTIPHNLIADYAGGGMHGAIGVLAAIIARQHTGRGQYVDVSMMDGSLALLAQAFSTYFAKGGVAPRGTTVMDGAMPNYDCYLTKDNKYITVAAIEPWFFANLCRLIGREDLIAHEFDREKRDELRTAITNTFKTKTRDEWFEIMSKTDICAGKMLTLDEVPDDPQVKAREMIVELDGPNGHKIKQVGISLKFSDTPGSIRSLGPSLGQHSDEILTGLGYGSDDIRKWREQGAIK
jgi:crotonobetainyl-CoA:carnitine CoA-transferase CaiB-like acyl-CoA transferase